MTDNTQELDEILAKTIYDTGAKLTEIGWERWGENLEEAKLAILDWHNKQIEEVLDRLKISLKGYRTHRIGSHSDDWGGESDRPCFCDLEVTIEAERNKLKESNDG